MPKNKQKQANDKKFEEIIGYYKTLKSLLSSPIGITGQLAIYNRIVNELNELSDTGDLRARNIVEAITKRAAQNKGKFILEIQELDISSYPEIKEKSSLEEKREIAKKNIYQSIASNTEYYKKFHEYYSVADKKQSISKRINDDFANITVVLKTWIEEKAKTDAAVKQSIDLLGSESAIFLNCIRSAQNVLIEKVIAAGVVEKEAIETLSKDLFFLLYQDQKTIDSCKNHCKEFYSLICGKVSALSSASYFIKKQEKSLQRLDQFLLERLAQLSADDAELHKKLSDFVGQYGKHAFLSGVRRVKELLQEHLLATQNFREKEVFSGRSAEVKNTRIHKR